MSYPRNWVLPDNNRMVFNISLAYEAFENHSQYSQGKNNGRDIFSLSYADYGWKAGLWRLFDTLEEFGIKATMSTNGLAAERHPEVVEAAVKLGHEIGGHGWANDVRNFEPEQELAEIRRCKDILTQVAGEPPVGWVCQGLSGTENTDRYLVEEGFLWNGDDASEDVPFLRKTPAGPLVIFPRLGLTMNDLPMWLKGQNSPSVIWDNFVDTFDQLYAEAVAGRPKLIDITFHGHVAGRPTLMPTIRKILRYAKQHEGVWFARRKDVAAHVRTLTGPGFDAD
jgi:peptidoglycan/xylan/chitin deacetylase (PgdA/CDA1 family)